MAGILGLIMIALGWGCSGGGGSSPPDLITPPPTNSGGGSGGGTGTGPAPGQTLGKATASWNPWMPTNLDGTPYLDGTGQATAGAGFNVHHGPQAGNYPNVISVTDPNAVSQVITGPDVVLGNELHVAIQGVYTGYWKDANGNPVLTQGNSQMSSDAGTVVSTPAN